MIRTLFLFFSCVGTLLAGVASAQSTESLRDGIAVLVISPDGSDPNVSARIERDLRNMYDDQSRTNPAIPRVIEIEPRFDVGNISKGTLSKAERHFNKAQRAIEKKDFAEATDQLFRAQRFYVRAIPYSSNPALLREIFYYSFKTRQAMGKEKQAMEAYCTYVALERAMVGSAGPLEQFQPLADRCGTSNAAGTAELKIKSNIDGGHVFIDGRRVGIVGRQVPFVAPFLAAGPHFVEVRRVGYVRWGTLVTLKNGASKTERARLKTARGSVLNSDLQPLQNVTVSGSDRTSNEYFNDLLFRMAEQYRVKRLVVAYLETKGRDYGLSILTFDGDNMERFDAKFGVGSEAHRPALSRYWKTLYGRALDPADAQPIMARFAPTIFKVE